MQLPCTFEDGVSSGIFTPVTKILENQLVAVSLQARKERRNQNNIVEILATETSGMTEGMGGKTLHQKPSTEPWLFSIVT